MLLSWKCKFNDIEKNNVNLMTLKKNNVNLNFKFRVNTFAIA